jgi:hypothetical protein
MRPGVPTLFVVPVCSDGASSCDGSRRLGRMARSVACESGTACGDWSDFCPVALDGGSWRGTCGESVLSLEGFDTVSGCSVRFCPVLHVVMKPLANPWYFFPSMLYPMTPPCAMTGEAKKNDAARTRSCILSVMLRLVIGWSFAVFGVIFQRLSLYIQSIFKLCGDNNRSDGLGSIAVTINRRIGGLLQESIDLSIEELARRPEALYKISPPISNKRWGKLINLPIIDPGDDHPLSICPYRSVSDIACRRHLHPAIYD